MMSVSRCPNSLILSGTSRDYDRPVTMVATSAIFDYWLGVIAPAVIFLAADRADTLSGKSLTHVGSPM
jgi:hypothetical protein